MNKNNKFLLSATAITAVLAFSSPVISISNAEIVSGEYAKQPLNALANEDSPYLKQHARDLVQWNSWTEKTLEQARKSGKPIFVSIGYSACHWCHVMQKESFNNPAVAKILNEQYTPILIDREQRPDLDETYMLATEAITGQGGWPNNVLLTPDLKPFYGGVYFPPADLNKLLSLIAIDWASDKSAIVIEAERIAAILTGFFNRKVQAKELSEKVVRTASAKIVKQFDTFNGGIGTAPKHFNSPTLSFLAHQAGKADSQEAKEVLMTTLRAIAKGGVRDHLTGGFHRYAVDNNWRVPHFEKMLYDQAQLSMVFTRAAALTGDPEMEKVARSTLDYVLADLTSPNGGFYSTRDADSEGEEGTFYIWSPDQLQKTLGKDGADFIVKKLGTISQGEFVGKVILHRDIELDEDEKTKFENLLQKMALARKNRIAPHRDEKIIVSWNGLMISAFAVSAQQFGDKPYGDAAIKAADFIWNNMRADNGDLYRTYYGSRASIISTLPDYAFYGKSLIDVYDLTGDVKWLERAKEMAAKLETKFRDKKIGDYFFTETKQGYARIKLRSDTALPAGNAVALVVSEMLSMRSLDPKYSRRTETIVAALSGDAVSDPRGGATTLASASRYLRGQTGNMQYAARGRVKVKATLNDDRTEMHVKVTLAPKWHVNADKPFEESFIPTKLSLRAADNKTTSAPVKYPKLVSRKLGFQDKPLALFENQFNLTMTLPKPATGTVTGVLDIQACNDEVCLLPETLTLKVTPQLAR